MPPAAALPGPRFGVGVGTRQRDAARDLQDAENSATSNDGDSFYAGNGRDSSINSTSNAKGIKGLLTKKRLGVIAIITTVLIGGGIFLGTSNSLLPAALSSLFSTTLDPQYASYATRAPILMSFMLLNNDKNVTTTTWSGVQKYAKIPTTLKTNLANAGIEVVGSGDSTHLVWTQANGQQARIEASRFNDFYTNNPEFRETWTKANRGRVATFFDTAANTLFKKMGISRNLNNGYVETSDAKTNTAEYEKRLSSRFDDSEIILKNDTKHIVTEEDEDGKPYDVEKQTRASETTKPLDNSAEATAKATSSLRSIADSIGQIGTWACTFYKFGSMISVMVAANEIQQSINYFMGNMENVSKMKAGLGNETPINEFLNFMSTSTSTKITDFSSVKATNLNSDNPEFTIDENYSETGSPLEANGVQMVMGNAPAKATTTTNYSISRVQNSVLRVFNTGATTIHVCAGVAITQSLVSMGLTFATGGIAKAVGSLASSIGKVAVGIGAMSFIAFLIPTVAQMFINPVGNIAGIPAGELFAKGGANTGYQLAQSGSGHTPASEEAVLAFNQVNNSILALEAEIDRNNLSPFDVTNKNTFFGNIAYNLLPTLTTTKASSVASFLRSSASSLASITGRVSATGENNTFTTTFGSNCDNLREIGVAGDIYCNPIVVVDTETLDLNPFDNIAYQAIIDQNTDCDSEGNCTIKRDSNLAKYISYCVNRSSPMGTVDQNILNELNLSGKLGIFGSFLGVVPFFGDGLTLIDEGLNEINLPWANGQRCSNTADNREFWTTEGRFYQRYVEDNRILEDMGAFEGSKNPVLGYIEEYDAEHPINNYAGYLSNISGILKEDVEIVLAFVDYYQFLDQYDIDSRIAIDFDYNKTQSGEYIATLIQETIPHDFTTNTGNYSQTVYIAQQRIIYADVRNRSYLV